MACVANLISIISLRVHIFVRGEERAFSNLPAQLGIESARCPCLRLYVEMCSRSLMYRWSLRASTLSITLHTVMYFIVSCVTHDNSTMDSPCHRTQALLPELWRRMSRSVGNSATMLPFVSALGDPHSEFIALKSPSTIKGWTARGDRW